MIVNTVSSVQVRLCSQKSSKKVQFAELLNFGVTCEDCGCVDTAF